MNGGSVDTALDRIEAALDRAERAATVPATEDGALREKHERLRQAVAQSLRKLDNLLAGQPQ